MIMNSMSGNWVANAAFFKTTAGHKLGIGHREKINDINLYFPSYFERLTSNTYMGELFKVALLLPNGNGFPPGFISLQKGK